MVILIGKTQIDYARLKSKAEEYLLKSPYLEDMKDYLTFLNNLKKANISKQLTLEEPGHLLRHISYSFLIVSDRDTVLDFIRTTTLEIEYQLCINPDEYFTILTGNLEDWRTVVINDLESLRPYLNKILILLELEGYSKLWLGYRKQKTDEHTFKLVKE